LHCPLLAAAKPLGEQPNVLLILGDGLPAWILGCYGNREVRTPNIDLLAQTGTRFLNHYACAPVADKARASLLTGRTTMQLKDSGEVTLEKLLGGIGYSCGTRTDGAEALRFLDAQSAAKPFFLTAALAPYASLAGRGGIRAGEAGHVRAGIRGEECGARQRRCWGRRYCANLRRVAAGHHGARSRNRRAGGEDRAEEAAGQHADHPDFAVRIPLWTARPVGLGRCVGPGEHVRGSHCHADGVELVRGMWCRWPPGRRWSAPTTWSPRSAISTPAQLPERNLCGRSYLALASGRPLPKKQPWRTTVFAQYGDTAMARSDRYKLIARNQGGELYDDKGGPA